MSQATAGPGSNDTSECGGHDITLTGSTLGKSARPLCSLLRAWGMCGFERPDKTLSGSSIKILSSLYTRSWENEAGQSSVTSNRKC